MFVLAIIANTSCKFLIDTGACATVLSSRMSDKLGLNGDFRKSVGQTLTTANGNPMSVMGEIGIGFKIGNRYFEQDMVVADISEIDGILGMDFLHSNDVSLNIARATMKIGDETFPLIRERQTHCARVKASRNITVPPQSEIVVKASIKGDIGSTNDGIFEPANYLTAKGLLLARSLVNPRSSKTSVSVINLSDKPVNVKKYALNWNIRAGTKQHQFQ